MEQHTVQDYLRKLLLPEVSLTLSQEDTKKIERDLQKFIVDKLTRKKFRRRQLAESTRAAITEKVADSVSRQAPIHLVVPFGGYKHFSSPTHPEPDWAELFNFRYLTDLVTPILAAYQPGVLIEYVSEDMILRRMNNYPQSALDAYSEVFTKLIEWWNKQTPENLEFQYFRVGNRVDQKKIVEEVEAMLPERRKAFAALDTATQEQELHRSRRSIMWKGDLDLSTVSESKREEIIIESRLIELAYYEIEAKPEFLDNYLARENHICICFSFGLSHDNDEFQDLTLGSTYGSIVDYWIGHGILRTNGAELRPDIVSRSQYEEFGNKLNTVPVTDILPFKNYGSIEVL